LHQSIWDHKILYAGTSSEDEQLLMRQLLRKIYEHGGRFKVKIYILFCGDNSRTIDRIVIVTGWYATRRPRHYDYYRSVVFPI
jgi:hypothetical protein